MSDETFDILSVIADHQRWLQGKAGGRRADFSWQDLTGHSLAFKDLRSAKFTGTILHGASLLSADLRDADLFGATLTDADLSSAQMTSADLRGALMQGARLEETTLDDADMRGGSIMGRPRKAGRRSSSPEDMYNDVTGRAAGVDMSNTYVKKSSLQNAQMNGAYMVDAKVLESDLTGVNLSKAQLQDSNFSGSVMKNANITDAVVQGAIFRHVDMNGAKIQNVDLSQVDLTGANLLKEDSGMSANLVDTLYQHYLWVRDSGAQGEQAIIMGENMSRLDLVGSNLSGARLINTKMASINMSYGIFIMTHFDQCDMRNSFFTKSVMDGANFEGCNLSFANLEQCSFRPTPIKIKGVIRDWPANLKGVNLTQANLKKADLMGADLTGANLTGANLKGANLINAKLDGAILKNAIMDKSIEPARQTSIYLDES